MQNNYQKMSVEDLAQRAQQGDSQAFAQLYERFHASIYHYALKLARNDADAKDIVQDTFVQAQLSIKSLKEPKLFKVWLNKIAFSRATRLFAHNKTISFDPEDSFYADHIADERREMNPQDMIRFQSDRELLDHFIAQLPPEQQSALIFMYYDHYTLNEIAAIMDIPVGTVKSRIHMAKAKLNDMISRYEQRNDTKVTFKGDALVAALTMLFHDQWGDLSKAVTATTTKKQRFTDHLNTTFGKAILLTGSIVACTVIGVFSLLPDTPSPITDSDEEVSQQIQLYPFSPITYHGVTYQRAEDVYYALIDFAHCDTEMAMKTKADFQEVLPLYEALKAYGGIYYDKLNENNWIALFEATNYE